MFAVIRIRGETGVRKKVRDTLELLRLKACNNCVLIPQTESYKGMLTLAGDYITWGELKKETLVKMLKKRLRQVGRKRIDEKILEKIAGYKTFEDLAEDLISGKAKLKDFKQLQPVFRLTPPSKGFKSVKLHYPKGDLGYRGKEINKLIEKMI